MNTTKNLPDIPENVPVFLRKTYHMINSCEESICFWSDDGKTFTITDPNKFETQIIPVFFKHSKFSSFVRQLNFYSFKKIKFSDNIRINLEEEKKTANYWKFRHPHFLRGRPDLLINIKRMSNGKAKPKETLPETSEVQSLKKRIEEMSKTMDELTTMVQKVSLRQAEEENSGSKRKKVDGGLAPDAITSTDLEELAALPLPDAPVSNPQFLRQSSEVSDSDFVDQLFSAFEEEETTVETPNHNSPDPELMRRLSDALELLPKNIQEMIVNRLIDSITSHAGLQVTEDNEQKIAESQPSLAAATLAALLHHYPSNKSIPVIPVHA